MSRPRTPAGRFLGPTGIRYSPMRELPSVADEQDLIDRIRAATTIRDEPECVGPRWLRDYAEVSALHRSQQHAQDVALAQNLRPLLDAEDRVRDIMRRAKYAKVDLQREGFLMRQDIDRAKAGGRMVPRRTLDRMEGLEALLDGVAARAA